MWHWWTCTVTWGVFAGRLRQRKNETLHQWASSRPEWILCQKKKWWHYNVAKVLLFKTFWNALQAWNAKTKQIKWSSRVLVQISKGVVVLLKLNICNKNANIAKTYVLSSVCPPSFLCPFFLLFFSFTQLQQEGPSYHPGPDQGFSFPLFGLKVFLSLWEFFICHCFFN